MHWALEWNLPTCGRRRERLGWVEGIGCFVTHGLAEPPTSETLAIAIVPIVHEDLALVLPLDRLTNVILTGFNVYAKEQLRRQRMFCAIGDGNRQARDSCHRDVGRV